jgi:hypothetical protein
MGCNIGVGLCKMRGFSDIAPEFSATFGQKHPIFGTKRHELARIDPYITAKHPFFVNKTPHFRNSLTHTPYIPEKSPAVMLFSSSTIDPSFRYDTIK